MKWLFVWSPSDATTIEAFARDARAALTQRLRGIPHVTLHLTERTTPRLSVIPFARLPLAMITVRGEPPAMERARTALESLGGSLAGYRVAESVPRARVRSSPTDEGAGPACLLTFFRKHPRIDRERFFHEWYERHSPLALRIHPLVGYTRNAVEETVVAGSPPWDGIVAEDFAAEHVVLNPLELFGGVLRALPNMVRVGLHVSSFLDLRTIENHLVREIVIAD